MMLAAAGGLVAAVVMRLRQQNDGITGASAADGTSTEPGPDSARSEAGTGLGFETDDGPDPDMNGHSTIT